MRNQKGFRQPVARRYKHKNPTKENYITAMWKNENSTITGTALVVKGPDKDGLYTMQEITGPTDQVKRIPEGIKSVVGSSAFKERAINIDLVYSFQRSGNIETVTVLREDGEKAIENLF